jgi:hypothetical protein
MAQLYQVGVAEGQVYVAGVPHSQVLQQDIQNLRQGLNLSCYGSFPDNFDLRPMNSGSFSLYARADRVSRGGANGATLTLEGHARLSSRRGEHLAEVRAERIVVDLLTGRFEAENACRGSTKAPDGAAPIRCSSPGSRVELPSPKESSPPQGQPLQALWERLLELCSRLPIPVFVNRYEPDPDARMEQLLFESEDLRQIHDEVRRFWVNDQPSHMINQRVKGGIGP